MKHKGIMFTLIAMLLSVILLPGTGWAKPAVPEHTDAFYVNDFAGVIDLKAENYMVNYGVKLHQETGAQVVLVTVDSTGGASMEEYAKTLFNNWGIGSADKDNGVLLLLSVKDDNYWVLQGDGLKNSLTDSMLSQILAQSLEPDFARKEYAAGARKTYGALIESLGGVWTEPLGTRNFVADNAGVLPQVTRLYLNQSSNRYKTTTGSGIYFVTVKNPGGKTLQDYTYAKYASVGAGPRDVMLVLDIEGDNYHVLQGRDVDTTLTNTVVGEILNKALEPQFAAKNYAAGVTAAANEFFSFFLARADHSPAADQASSGAAEAAEAVTNQATASIEAVETVSEPISKGKGFAVVGIFLGVLGLISLAFSRRNSHIARYGLPVNPYSRRNIRRYGTWHGQPGYGYGSRWYNRRHRPRRRTAHYNNTEPQQSRSSFWNTNHGGGGSSSGGGAGRHSSSETNHGGGGYSSGGGSGRYSSRNDDDDRSSRSSSSSSSSGGGGGNASSGGGVGRHG